MTNKNYFINGITDLLILSILNNGDTYVYDIVKSIAEFSDKDLEISMNTVYTATYKLENEGKISEYSKLVGKKRTRVYYHIEEKGVEYLQELQESYKRTIGAVEKIFDNLNQAKSEKEESCDE